MGCDFYIRIYLEIETQNGTVYYELPEKRGWYCGDYLEAGHANSDDEEDKYDAEQCATIEYAYNAMKKYCLMPRKPFVLYQNYRWFSKAAEKKYLPWIHKKIAKKYVEKWRIFRDNGTIANMSDVVKITKKEFRYEIDGDNEPEFYNEDDSDCDSDSDSVN